MLLPRGAVLEAVTPRLLPGDIWDVRGKHLRLLRTRSSRQTLKAIDAPVIFEGRSFRWQGLVCILENILAHLPLVRVEGVPAALEEPLVAPGRVFLVAAAPEFFCAEGCFEFVLATGDSLARRVPAVSWVLGWGSRAGAVRGFRASPFCPGVRLVGLAAVAGVILRWKIGIYSFEVRVEDLYVQIFYSFHYLHYLFLEIISILITIMVSMK